MGRIYKVGASIVVVTFWRRQVPSAAVDKHPEVETCLQNHKALLSSSCRCITQKFARKTFSIKTAPAVHRSSFRCRPTWVVRPLIRSGDDKHECLSPIFFDVLLEGQSVAESSFTTCEKTNPGNSSCLQHDIWYRVWIWSYKGITVVL